MIKINVKDKILEVSKLLDEIDEYGDSLPNALSIVDSKICDLMHLIEINTLKTNQCYRIVRELHKLRLERRKIKNNMDLLQVFKTEKNKLINIEYRKFLLNAIYKEDRRQNNAKYNNRIYSEEELKELLGV